MKVNDNTIMDKINHAYDNTSIGVRIQDIKTSENIDGVKADFYDGRLIDVGDPKVFINTTGSYANEEGEVTTGLSVVFIVHARLTSRGKVKKLKITCPLGDTKKVLKVVGDIHERVTK